jgi:hypothetical protein
MYWHRFWAFHHARISSSGIALEPDERSALQQWDCS